MPTFSYREKNVTISVRCGARCRAYHASSMGEGKGSPHNCAPARFLFFGFFNSMESAFPYEENISVQPNPVRSARAEPSATRTWCFTIRKALFLRPETPRHLGPIEPPAAGAWCFTVRKDLFLRPEAPRLSSGSSLRRPGRGTSPSAKPYSSVRRHHVYRPGRASGDPGVVLHRPQSLISSFGSTTSIGPAEPPATRASLFP